MLKKEKKRAQDAAAQLAQAPSEQSPSSQSSPRSPTPPLVKDASTDTSEPPSADSGEGAVAVQCIKTGTAYRLIVFSFSLKSSV